jgi:hypothetical protein
MTEIGHGSNVKVSSIKMKRKRDWRQQQLMINLKMKL